MWATLPPSTIHDATSVPEMFQRKQERPGIRRWTLPYVADMRPERMRELLPELMARAYVHMQELGWPLGEAQDLWVGTHRERTRRLARSHTVDDYRRVCGIRFHGGALRSMVFTSELKLYKDGYQGSPEGVVRSTHFVALDPRTMSDSDLAYAFDGLCEILNYS